MSRTTALLARSADLLIDVPLLDIPMLREDPDVELVAGPSSRLCLLQLNVRSRVMQDDRFRRLLSGGIDRPALVEAVVAGEAQPASTVIPPGHWAALDYTLDPISADEVRASLQELDEPPGIALRLVASDGDPLLANTSVLLQEQLAWRGIALSLDLLAPDDMAVVLEEGTWDLRMSLTGHWKDPHEVVRPMLMSDGTDNVGGYANERVDYLAVLASRSGAEAYRAGFYQTIQQIVATEVPVIPLFFPTYFDAMLPTIQDYRPWPPLSAKAMRTVSMAPPQSSART